MTKFEDYANKYQTVRFERRGGILQMTLHTEGQSLQWGFLPHGELPEAFYDVGADRENKVVILTGTGAEFSGPRATPGTSSFPTRPNPERIDRIHWEGRQLLMRLLEIEVPVISAINGPAWRHSEIPLLCDIVLAADTAQFQDSAHFPSDVVPGDGMHIVMPLLLGLNRGRYYLLTGQTLDAQKAHEFGLVAEILPPDRLFGARLGAGRGSRPSANPAVALYAAAPDRISAPPDAGSARLRARHGDAGADREARGAPRDEDRESLMPLDHDAQTLLDMVRAANRPAFETVGPAEARLLYQAGRRVLAPEPMPIAELRDMAIPGPAGPIPLRLYRPSANGVLPVLVFFHGGGWVVGDIETHETVCRHLANRASCAVLSVDYRLAPEHKFPAAVDDCLAATAWVAENAASLRLDPARLSVGGDSAGGNLAAAVSLLARDAGMPRISYQLLIYPATDAAMRHASIARFADGYVLTRATMRWFYEQYLRDPDDAADWRVSPLVAPDVAELPPAFVLTAGYDPLCDEGDAYAERLVAAGVPVQHRRFPGQIHGFTTNGKIIRAAATALDEASAALKSTWS